MAKKEVKKKKKVKKNVPTAVAHVKSTFNNTIVTITDPTGNTLVWASAGSVGFKGNRKGMPYAAQMAAERAGQAALEHGVRQLDIVVKGPGSGREGAVRTLGSLGFDINTIRDVTPTPHNGCRPKKRRRV